MESCAWRFLAVRDSRIYHRAPGPDKAGKQLLILDTNKYSGVATEKPEALTRLRGGGFIDS